MNSTTDPIADMLTRIRNAISVSKNEIALPHSIIKESVAKLLVKNNFITNVQVEKNKVGKTLIITINSTSSNPRIHELKKLSKPGRRLYVNSREIPKVRQGRGIVILTTSKGIMSGEDARKQNIGGELICQVI